MYPRIHIERDQPLKMRFFRFRGTTKRVNPSKSSFRKFYHKTMLSLPYMGQRTTELFYQQSVQEVWDEGKKKYRIAITFLI